MRNKVILLIIAIIIILCAFIARLAHDNKTVGETLDKINKDPFYTSFKKIDSILLKDNKPSVTEKPVIPEKPYITAESYLVGNLVTGDIYLKNNIDKVLPIASLTKLFTAITEARLFDNGSQIKITQEILDKGFGEAGNLKPDESFSPKELLYPLILESSNDAAEAYAVSYGYDEFIKKMDSLASEVGLKNTNFRDSSGIDSGNVSSAEDLFTFSKYLYNNQQTLLSLTRERHMELATTTLHGSHSFTNINVLSLSPDFIGGKTGRTNAAKESMISMMRYTSNGRIYPIVIIVLRSYFTDREADTGKLYSKAMDIINSQ